MDIPAPVSIKELSVEQDGSPKFNELTPIFVGKTILTNNTDQEQTLSTNSFTKTIQNSVTNSTTHGFKLGTKATAKFQIPLVGETGMELSTEYNFSDTSSKTNSISYAYTASPQNIKVPAHSSVEVIVNLNQAKAKGDVKLLSKISSSANATFYYSSGEVYRLRGNLVYFANHAPDRRLSPNLDGTANLIGTGKYEVDYGTDFSVTVKPVSKNRISKRSVDEGYTYKVTPEIKKIGS
ncbi:ETX/MTX2 family pore-forming toxin [Paenibacillus larvae]